MHVDDMTDAVGTVPIMVVDVPIVDQEVMVRIHMDVQRTDRRQYGTDRQQDTDHDDGATHPQAAYAGQ